MNPPVRHGSTWSVLVPASLVVVGVFLQVYVIAAYLFGAGAGALDVHRSLGDIVRIFEVPALIAAVVAYWGRWRTILPAALLAVIGTAQSGRRTATSGSAASTACWRSSC